MIVIRLVSFVLVFSPFVASFRAPDNLPKDVKLPTIQGKPKVELSPQPKLSESRELYPSLRQPNHGVERKKWGVDKTHNGEYWYK